MNIFTKLATATVLLAGSQLASAGTWDCWAKAEVSVNGKLESVQLPGWKMSGFLRDREKKCLNALKSKYLNEGTLVKLGYDTKAEQNALCATGAGGLNVRFYYGFEQRKKVWQETLRVPFKCKENCTYDGF